MKHTIIIIVLSAFIINASAKKVVHMPDVTPVATVQHDVFFNTKTDINSNTIVFTGLPKDATAVRIIDAKGIVRVSGNINRTNNTLNIAKLPVGCYTVVLKQGSQAKMFGFYTDVIFKQGS